MDPRDLYPLVPHPDRNSLPPYPQDNVLRTILRMQRSVEANAPVVSSPLEETQHQDRQSDTAPPLYGRFLETVGSDQEGKQHFTPAYLELLELASPPTYQQLADRATMSKDAASTAPSPSHGGAADGDGMPSVATTKPFKAEATMPTSSSNTTTISSREEGSLPPSLPSAGAPEGDGTPSVATTKPVVATAASSTSIMTSSMPSCSSYTGADKGAEAASIATTKSIEVEVARATPKPANQALSKSLPPHLRPKKTAIVPKVAYSPVQQTSLERGEEVQSGQEHVVEVEASRRKASSEATSVEMTEPIEAEEAIATPEPANQASTTPLPPRLRRKRTDLQAAGSSKGLEASRWAPWNCK
ncbi:hypothetical protein KC332_g5422 [Hortaea werneckii]|nr:hypothetical protein KC358_g5528 [Hortaea werneckii]KAI6845397.1 hypothetical protein KC350_g4476 [Hortaea werneckii]KAI6937282.1 hypothetical protein KC348_g5777 [Hortaea werneckii]KAI6937739.1 hypothetical protein KC341_g5370 [Hortaea werneckii]KAI6973318.1 hypothetical protein KC321_g5738 [Hortaea werneckii]